MKKHIILFVSMAAVLTTSCNKFLDTPPDNRTEIDTPEKVTALLVSAYPKAGTSALFTELMSDDHDDIGPGYGAMSEALLPDMTVAWKWQDNYNVFQDTPTWFWGDCYGAIAASNLALVSIEKLGGADSNPRLRAAKGEALICRALNHFRLARVFCHAYAENTASTDLGIPYVTTPQTEINPLPSRGTLQQTYDLIAQDIEAAMPLIDDSYYPAGAAKYHFTLQAARGFAAEFYLFFRKYETVIKYADLALGSNPEGIMRDVSWYNGLQMDLDIRAKRYISSEDPANILLVTSQGLIGTVSSNWYYTKRYLHSDPICMNEGLAAPSILWSTSASREHFIMTPDALRGDDRGIMSMNVRLTVPFIDAWYSVIAEVSTESILLARAEALTMTDRYEDAMKDINLWVKKRIVERLADPKKLEDVVKYYTEDLEPYGYNGTRWNFSARKTLNLTTEQDPYFNPGNKNQEGLIHAILQLRRIEFFGEGKRWYDVKRFGIEIYRRNLRIINSEIVIESPIDQLTAKDGDRDPRWAIQLPRGVISAGMQPNPR